MKNLTPHALHFTNIEINPMSANSFISLNQISYAFPDGNGRSVIANISLTIKQGAFVVLVGPSGIGKSTLLRVLGGLLEPTSGSITRKDDNDTPVGIVFQRDNLMPWRTAYNNVKLPLEILGTDNGTCRQKSARCSRIGRLGG